MITFWYAPTISNCGISGRCEHGSLQQMSAIVTGQFIVLGSDANDLAFWEVNAVSTEVTIFICARSDLMRRKSTLDMIMLVWTHFGYQANVRQRDILLFCIDAMKYAVNDHSFLYKSRATARILSVCILYHNFVLVLICFRTTRAAQKMTRNYNQTCIDRVNHLILGDWLAPDFTEEHKQTQTYIP